MTSASFATLRRVRWHHPEWWLLAAAAMAWLSIARSSHPSGHDHSAADPGMMLLMIVAMMLPLSLPNARHVALSSLWQRRQRAIAEFVIGYLAVTVVAELAMARGWTMLGSIIGSDAALAMAIAAAAFWEISPAKRRLLRRCEHTMPLAPSGWKADRDCVTYGASIGLTCFTMCWALMLVCATTAHPAPVMALIFGVQMSRRVDFRLPDMSW